MPVPTDITAGTLTITNGSTAVTGVGTSWLASDLRQGAQFIWIDGGDGFWAPIVESVESNSAITLAYPWEGPTLTGVAYRARYQTFPSAFAGQSRQLIDLIDNGNVLALTGLTGPGVPVFDGPHSMVVRPVEDFVTRDSEGAIAGITPFWNTRLVSDTTEVTARAGLGVTKQTSLSDTTSGALMGVGAFGLGVGADTTLLITTSGGMDSVTETGWRFIPSANAVTVGAPDGLAGIVWTGFYGSNNRVQTYFAVSGPTSRTFTRIRAGASYSTWREIGSVDTYARSNILGVVSQSGGVPTGAIIEQGSTAAGRYVRYADGTQVCWGQVTASLAITVAYWGGFRSAGATVTYPAAFSSLPTVIAGNSGDPGAFGANAVNTGGNTQTFINFTAVTSQPTAATRIGDWVAIGRWF